MYVIAIKRRQKRNQTGVKLHHIKHYRKGKAEDRNVRKERVKTQRKPAQLKRKRTRDNTCDPKQMLMFISSGLTVIS